MVQCCCCFKTTDDLFGPGQTGTGTVWYSDSWVQGQLGTVTDGYRCESWVQGQTGTSGATNGYRDNRAQVSQTGIATIGYNGATNGYSDNRIQV